MKQLLVIAGALVVFGVGTLVLIGAPRAEPQPTSSPTLEITARTSEEITGVLNDAGAKVVFESRRQSSSYASVQVRVDGVVLDASADLQENLRTLDGHGSALSAEHRTALVALSKGIERYLEPYKQTLPPHEDLLVRVVLYWSEAPVGFPLTRQEVRPQPRP